MVIMYIPPNVGYSILCECCLNMKCDSTDVQKKGIVIERGHDSAKEVICIVFYISVCYIVNRKAGFKYGAVYVFKE